MANYQSWKDALSQYSFTTGSGTSARTASALREGELAAMYENSLAQESLQQEQDALTNQKDYYSGSLDLQRAAMEQEAASAQAQLEAYYRQLAMEEEYNQKQIALAEEEMAAQEQANMIQGGVGALSALPSTYALGKWSGMWGADMAPALTSTAAEAPLASTYFASESAAPVASSYGVPASAAGEFATGASAAGAGEAALEAYGGTMAGGEFAGAAGAAETAAESAASAGGWATAAGVAGALAPYELASLLSGGGIPSITEIPGLWYESWFGEGEEMTPAKYTKYGLNAANYFNEAVPGGYQVGADDFASLNYGMEPFVNEERAAWLGADNLAALKGAWGSNYQSALDFYNRNKDTYDNYRTAMSTWNPESGGAEPSLNLDYGGQALTRQYITNPSTNTNTTSALQVYGQETGNQYDSAGKDIFSATYELG